MTAASVQGPAYPLRFGGSDAVWHRSEHAWTDAIDDWTTWLQAGQRSANTIYQRRWQLRRLFEAHAGRSPWRLSTDDLLRWLTGQGWGPETVKSTRAGLRSFYGWAVEGGRTRHDPSAGLSEVRVPRGLPRPAGDDVYVRALARADDKVTLMILLAGLAGLRASEIGRLRWDDRDGATLIIHGKGGNVRRVPVHATLAVALDAEHARRAAGFRGAGFFYDGDGAVWVFPGRTGAGMHPGHVSSLLSRALPGATGHQLRHRFLTRVLDETGNLAAAQELAGHASPATTRIYTRVSDDALRAAVDAI